MKVTVREGGSIEYRGATFRAGDQLSVPDEVGRRWVREGLASPTVRAKPVLPPTRPDL